MFTSFIVSPALTKRASHQRHCPLRHSPNIPLVPVNRRARPPSRFSMSASARRGILMLCTGNICRSPAAEAIMKDVIARRNLQSQFFVDSCGTGGGSYNWYKENGFSYHEGDLADPRMREAASKRGLNLESRSRPLAKPDFDDFEVIVAMDRANLDAIETARRYWGVQNPKARIVLMSEFSPDESFRGKAVPDPYWSGQDGFEYALDLLMGACEGLADHLAASPAKSSPS